MLIEALEKEKKALKRELAAKVAAEVTAKVAAEVTAKVAAEVTAKVKLEQQTEFARKMLSEGFTVPRIANLTGLSEKVIRQLKQKMEN
jgi:hypothetical protein